MKKAESVAISLFCAICAVIFSIVGLICIDYIGDERKIFMLILYFLVMAYGVEFIILNSIEITIDRRRGISSNPFITDKDIKIERRLDRIKVFSKTLFPILFVIAAVYLKLTYDSIEASDRTILYFIGMFIVYCTAYMFIRTGDASFNDKYKPSSEIAEKWVCQEAHMYFYTKIGEFIGEMGANGENRKIAVEFSVGGPYMWIYQYDETLRKGKSNKEENLLLECRCKFQKGRFRAKIERNYADKFDDDISMLTFVREE